MSTLKAGQLLQGPGDDSDSESEVPIASEDSTGSEDEAGEEEEEEEFLRGPETFLRDIDNGQRCLVCLGKRFHSDEDAAAHLEQVLKQASRRTGLLAAGWLGLPVHGAEKDYNAKTA